MISDSRRIIAKNWIKRINQNDINTNVCEIGCGFGHLTSDLTKNGISCYGIDISKKAIEKAKLIYPKCKFYNSDFLDFNLFNKEKTNVFLFAEITWYILPSLKKFLKNLVDYKAKNNFPIYLIHILTTYPPGVQKYGIEYFTDLDGILKFFNLDYLETGSINYNLNGSLDSQGTYFISRIL